MIDIDKARKDSVRQSAFMWLSKIAHGHQLFSQMGFKSLLRWMETGDLD